MEEYLNESLLMAPRPPHELLEVGAGIRQSRRGARDLDWDLYRNIICQLYEKENRPLREVCQIMQERYGFVATERMFKTRFQNWGIRKYRVTKAFDRELARCHGAQSEVPRTVGTRLEADATEFSSRLGQNNPVKPESLDTMTGENLLSSPQRSGSPSTHPLPLFELHDTWDQSPTSLWPIHTPQPSRNTSRPTSSDIDSPFTPNSVDRHEVYDTSAPILSVPDPFSDNVGSSMVRTNSGIFAPRAQRPSEISHGVSEDWMRQDEATIRGQIVDQVMGLSSPSAFSTPPPDQTFETLMRAPLNNLVPHIDSLGPQPNDMLRPDQVLDFESPLPETWLNLCFYTNLSLGQERIEEADQCMLRAAIVYQKLVQERNNELLSIVNIAVATLFFHGKGPLAVKLVSQARMAASTYLDDENPIMVSLAFIIAMAKKNTSTCGIKIQKLREVTYQMKLQWGQGHPFSVAADYNLAWRMAKEPDLWAEALGLLALNQEWAEAAPDILPMQTVSIIATRARVLGHLGRHLEAEKAVSEALQRLRQWGITEHHPYYVAIKRRQKVFVERLDRSRLTEL